jgi:hypothetical protein
MMQHPLEEVVAQWVRVPRAEVEHAVHATPGDDRIPLSGTEELRLDTPFERTADRALPTWRAQGRLLWHGPMRVRLARIEVDVTAWTDDAAEVSVRPAGRRLLTWGPRRERRYFHSAHRAANVIADAVGRGGDPTQRPAAA